MNNKDTFEYEKNDCELEYIEWDDIWRENAPDNYAKRILIIGDSIARGYRGILNKKLDKRAYVDQLATSKAINNSGYIKLFDYLRSQCDRYDIVQFNNGLHGWQVEDAEYESFLKERVLYLKKIYSEAKIIIVSSTPIRIRGNKDKMSEQNNMVIGRNKVASRVAEEIGAEYIDLYDVLDGKQEWFIDDGVHLIDAGYEALANKCLEIYNNLL